MIAGKLLPLGRKRLVCDDIIDIVKGADLCKRNFIELRMVGNEKYLIGAPDNSLLRLGDIVVGVGDAFFHTDRAAGYKCLVHVIAAQGINGNTTDKTASCLG